LASHVHGSRLPDVHCCVLGFVLMSACKKAVFVVFALLSMFNYRPQLGKYTMRTAVKFVLPNLTVLASLKSPIARLCSCSYLCCAHAASSALQLGN
jgi:hypothetical protein